jgi:hypothetical protein
MKSYTYSEARQHFAAILEQAWRDGAVRIQRRDGQSFVVRPEPTAGSPLAIAGIHPQQPITQDDILASIHAGRWRADATDVA